MKKNLAVCGSYLQLPANRRELRGAAGRFNQRKAVGGAEGRGRAGGGREA